MFNNISEILADITTRLSLFSSPFILTFDSLVFKNRSLYKKAIIKVYTKERKAPLILLKKICSLRFKNIPLRKTNRTSNRPISRLNDEHKEHLLSFLTIVPWQLFRTQRMI
ncbi:uncharacterized protein B0P05DRAFT_559442 [Gilbertella persicaria]|uniref:uncharacterized protein n=1 Tax=Gilbertella persicaria TaxID=101096 RepID=UPI0022202C59|nr:uncharacterized protein B0P05DRAFT_559442 [Gilbertella persicaria]KAI8058683.1 hypothetical protein B0P05DRAFT_559442 [Gilbertella persicaria]